MTTDKVCNLCKHLLPVESFYNRPDSPDGKDYRCSACRRRCKAMRGNPLFGTMRLTTCIMVKACARCKSIRPRTEFFLNSSARDRLSRECKPCGSARNRQRLYGVTPQEFRKMLVAQNYKCPLCGDTLTEATAYVDHDHATGEVRGLLDTSCNAMLGMAKDNVDTLLAAAHYLTAYTRK